MKEFWLQKKDCTGCGVCANVCPKNAIHMKSDECGFIYPEISERCVECNACQQICESRMKRDNQNFLSPRTYAAWSRDDGIRYTSTSGGAFTELARIILRRGGYVAGAQYRDDNMVEHSLVSDETGLERIRQSKYIQSNAGNIYQRVKEKLREGKNVAFCGAPCQVAALYAYLGKKQYENLYTIDFICRGVNSPKAYLSWLKEIEKTYKTKVSRVWFKYKQGGWKKSPRCTKLDFANGKNVVLDQDENLFMTGYLGANLYIRPSCGDCKFKGVPRQGDLTLADFWGLDEKLDDDKGTSMILINSAKGEELFEQAREQLVVYERDFNEIFEGNVCFKSSVQIPADAEKFLRDLDNDEFSRVLKKYTRVSLFKKIKRRLKRIKSGI